MQFTPSHKSLEAAIIAHACKADDVTYVLLNVNKADSVYGGRGSAEFDCVRCFFWEIMVLCCVFGCNSRSASNKKEHQDLSFHKFPRNASIRRWWEMRISRSKENMPSNPVVCSRHFTPESFRGGSYKVGRILK